MYHNNSLQSFSQSRTRSGASFHNSSAFMSSVIEKLHLVKPIIVSPSASGSYSVPYVIENRSTIGGFVPVAACCVRNHKWRNFMVCFTKFKFYI
ncbi:unnamed protein product [Onchocerca flexuosa]|uniref:Ovule protein n=1 Tax=Onchocerca flexuosa TaxID=387005 RepID=A0A183HSB6_9BILA|nr:unnamed protein product [Onchocerca flexuosa]